jgi:hypothetical protein
VTTAFLNGELEEEIYMDCPDGMEHRANECLLLEKTIYGLVQSARQYFKKFSDILVSKMNFSQCKSDPCMFIRRNNMGICIILCYVDDNLTVGDPRAIRETLKEIKQHGLEIIVGDKLTDYLSCEIRFNEDKSKGWIGQPHMIKKIERTFGEETKKLQSYRTPGTPGLGLVKVTEIEEKIPEEMQRRYRSGVGMLLFLIKHSRPDIANSVRELTESLSLSLRLVALL